MTPPCHRCVGHEQHHVQRLGAKDDRIADHKTCFHWVLWYGGLIATVFAYEGVELYPVDRDRLLCSGHLHHLPCIRETTGQLRCDVLPGLLSRLGGLLLSSPVALVLVVDLDVLNNTPAHVVAAGDGADRAGPRGGRHHQGVHAIPDEAHGVLEALGTSSFLFHGANQRLDSLCGRPNDALDNIQATSTYGGRGRRRLGASAALWLLGLRGSVVRVNVLNLVRHTAGQVLDGVAYHRLALLDALGHELEHIRHIGMEITQRAILRLAEPEEGLDLVGYSLDGLTNFSDRTGDTVNDALDDVGTPLQGLSRQRRDPVDCGLESLDDTVLDIAHRLGDAVQDVRERGRDPVPNIREGLRDEAPDGRPNAGQHIPDRRQNRADDIQDAVPDIRGKLLDCLPQPGPVAGKQSREHSEQVGQHIKGGAEHGLDRVPHTLEVGHDGAAPGVPERRQGAENGRRHALDDVPHRGQQIFYPVPDVDEAGLDLLTMLRPEILQPVPYRYGRCADDAPDGSKDGADPFPDGDQGGFYLLPVLRKEVPDPVPNGGAGGLDGPPRREKERFYLRPGVNDFLPDGLNIDPGLLQKRPDYGIVALHKVDEVLNQQSNQYDNGHNGQRLQFDATDSGPNVFQETQDLAPVEGQEDRPG